MAQLELIPFDSVDSVKNILSLDSSLDNAFIKILEYTKKYHEARTIIIEHQYIDKDFSNEFSNLYSKTFRPRIGYCKRLHFFSRHSKNVEELIQDYDASEYLGFVINRPVEVGKVGRSIIKPSHSENFHYLCNITRDVHLLGNTLSVKGAPFMEQDSMVITCAQASIWMVAKYMHHKHAHARHLPFDITDKASAVFGHTGRSLPSSGLTLEQMSVALNSMGYFPILYCKPHEYEYEDDKDAFEADKRLWRPSARIYSYIESGIPVIISFKTHTCVAIGHKFYDKTDDIPLDKILLKANKYESEKRKYLDDKFYPSFLPSSIFLDALVINDDQDGPYRLLPSSLHTRNLLKQEYSDLLSSKYNNILDDAEAIIIPLPDKIYLLSEDVYQTSKDLFYSEKEGLNLMYYLDQQIERGNKYAEKLAESIVPDVQDPIIFRIYFMKSVDFKAKIKNNKSISNTVRDYYLAMDMPRFIWISEISTFSMFADNHKILGEILFDSTANKFDHYKSFLSIHLPGFFFQNDHITGNEIREEEISLEEPYQL